jgi:hypothetical protein
MERSKQTSDQTKMRCDKNYITHKTSGMWTNNINKFKSITNNNNNNNNNNNIILIIALTKFKAVIKKWEK